MRKWFFPLLLLMLGLAGCAVNPVTGENELALVSESTELKIGAEQYGPTRQMQGGDYVTEPAVEAYVQKVGQRLAAVSDRKLPYEFSVINDSTPNAWALPGGKIAVNRGLLVELDNEAELAAVLGHEIVHAAARHGAKGMERGMLLQGAVMVAGVASQNSEYSQLAVGGAGLAAQLLNQKYSRDAESESDEYGMRYMVRAGYDPQAAVGLQETFVRLSEGRNSNWLNGLFASHPPSQERVEANRQTAARLPAGGTLGREPYRRAMAPLLKDREAYQAFDEGRQALASGNTSKALQLAEKALAIEPREALFHSLRADVRFKQGRYQDAVTNYDRALQLNSEYFHFYLQRGLARLELQNSAQGRTDLQKSVDLLPTAPALNALGQLALKGGKTAAAKEYFAAAAGSSSAAGREANRSLVRLDLPDNPDKYLRLELGRDNSGRLVARVTNRTDFSVNDIVLFVRVEDKQGRSREFQQRFAYYLEPKQARTMELEMNAEFEPVRLAGQVVRARILE